MTVAKILLFPLTPFLMTAVCHRMTGIDLWLSTDGAVDGAGRLLAFVEIVSPFFSAAAIGLIALFATAGSSLVRMTGWGVIAGSLGCIAIAAMEGAQGLYEITEATSPERPPFSMIDPAVSVGAVGLTLTGLFGLRVALTGNVALRSARPRRMTGRRALHGEAKWMSMRQAQALFGSKGGIVVGEAYRVDESEKTGSRFRADDRESWGRGGKAPLLCFDGAFGSSHGLVFAGSGGFKTTSVTIPTAMQWAGALIVLDPSNEVAPLVSKHRAKRGRRIVILDPHRPETGFNVLDWIGKFGSTKEEDIAAVASWIMSESGRSTGLRDDFFRASAQQLLTAIIADICLSGHTAEENQTLRQARANLSEPEPQLRKRLQEIYDGSGSDFVRENVATFVNMTPETFSGVYANAIKETHWLSYGGYAALVSGSTFSTDEIAQGRLDIFIALDLKTLENHAGLARVIIGSLLNAIYNRNGRIEGRALFLLEEAARLGPMRIIETARDAGRKYGITLTMIFQSIGQLRETYGGRDASSKWFESASWISFAAINDPETAEYISRRAGMTTVEIDQVSRSTQVKGVARTRSTQIAARPLILPHEVLLMRADEQIIFMAGHPPLRCGRAIWFRRKEMRAAIGTQ